MIALERQGLLMQFLDATISSMAAAQYTNFLSLFFYNFIQYFCKDPERAVIDLVLFQCMPPNIDKKCKFIQITIRPKFLLNVHNSKTNFMPIILTINNNLIDNR